MKRFPRLWRFFRLSIFIILGCLILVGSTMTPGDRTERVRAFTREIEFDFIGWTLDALRVKFFESALGLGDYMTLDHRHELVVEYLALISRIQEAENQLRATYADPTVTNPQQAAEPLQRQLSSLYGRRDQIAPLAESILQSQINEIVDKMDISLGGQAVPPVLYHTTPLPLALVVSPREIIRMDENVSLIPDLPVGQQVELEDRVDRSLDVSSLVVRIGGIGTYPTMVNQTSQLEWLSEVIAHEWVHNYLTLRPLGINYMTSPELRVMNETAASIAGKEIGRVVLEAFYPELAPPPQPESEVEAEETEPEEPLAFDFRAEMHQTRIKVDELLAEGRIDEAEQYMEMRRKIFWENGYRSLRKLNQAYFAFHGAYADQPGGAAAADDPVG